MSTMIIPAPECAKDHLVCANRAITWYKRELENTRNVECPYKAPHDIAFESKRNFEVAKLEVLLSQWEMELARLHAAGYEIYFLGGTSWKVIRHQDNGSRFEQEVEVAEGTQMSVQEWAEVIGKWKPLS